MRRSLLCLAVATALLAACGQSRTTLREEPADAVAEVGRDQAARQRADEQDAEAAAPQAVLFADPASAQGALASQPKAMPMPAPVPVTVGGATVFALPVERFEQI